MLRPLSLLCPLLALPLLALRTAQESRDRQDGTPPKEQRDPPRDFYGRPIVNQDGEAPASLLGGWQLLALHDEMFDEDHRAVRGMLLISEDYLAIELHILWTDEYDDEDEFYSQSGIHEYVYDPVGKLVTRSLIGSYTGDEEEDEEELEWEDQGVIREFRVRVTESFLTLSRDDGSRLEFGRMRPTHRAVRNFYGGSMEEETTEERGAVRRRR